MAILPIAPTILPDGCRAVANSQIEIKKRLALGEIAWAGPLLLVTARPVLFVLSQATLATVFALLHRPSAWRSAGAWWSVYGTLVDICCLGLMARFGRRERIGVRDLVGESAPSLGTRYFCRNRTVPFDFSCLHGRQLRQ